MLKFSSKMLVQRGKPVWSHAQTALSHIVKMARAAHSDILVKISESSAIKFSKFFLKYLIGNGRILSIIPHELIEAVTSLPKPSFILIVGLTSVLESLKLEFMLQFCP